MNANREIKINKINYYVLTVIMMLTLAFTFSTTLNKVRAENIEETSVNEDILDRYNPDNIDKGVVVEGNMEELGDKVSEKLYEVVALVQKIAIPLCIIFFIASAFTAITGAGNKNGFMGGLIGMLISALALAGIIYANEIVAFIVAWTAT